MLLLQVEKKQKEKLLHLEKSITKKEKGALFMLKEDSLRDDLTIFYQEEVKPRAKATFDFGKKLFNKAKENRKNGLSLFGNRKL
jgi:hypothetical protein